jgi:hypothetical protein
LLMGFPETGARLIDAAIAHARHKKNSQPVSSNSRMSSCALRPGNVHSADGWRAVPEPVVARYRGIVKRLYFRGDATFANPEI